ncbi:MAG: hypothetical protein J5772_09265 [Clostridia bacterium]|nr:hypothetical protein [Clostridia bacterium]
MKRMYKKVIALLLAAAALFSLAGCRNNSVFIEDADCFEKYMDAFTARDFKTAYSYFSKQSTTPPEEAPKEGEPAEYITEEDYVKKMEAIFSALEVSSVRYDKISESAENGELVVSYSMTYDTGKAGTLRSDYEMRLVTESGKRRVLWTPAQIFPGMTWGSTVRVNSVPARRGDILASGELLAETIDLHAVVAELDEIEYIDEFAVTISELLDLVPEDTLNKLMNAKGSTVLLAQLNDMELTPDLNEALDGIEGVTIIKKYGTDRYYPKGSLLAHTIGYVGYVEESELESLNEGRTETDGLYTTHSIVGRSGVERAYESVLRGKDGLTVTIRDANGDYVSTIYKKPVEDGADVLLTIDLALQERAEQVMDMVLWGDDTAGAVVVMNPVTAEIKALVSYPAYDLNELAISASAEYYDMISNQPNKPLQNRTTLGLYAPGSAMKIFTAAAALELGVAGPDYVFTGNIVDDYWTPTGYGRWIWPPIKRTEIKKRSEPMNMANCLLHSDNIYFANLALMMGEDSFLEYLRGIGFEQRMPFELSVARSTLKVKADSPEDWNLRSIAETGYGQGQVTVSPLQMAAVYSAFRNGGNVPVPRLAKALYKTEGVDYVPVQTFEKETWIEGAFEESTIETLLPMMENIMSRDYNGTGRRLRARGCTVAGKTGTAEIGSVKAREVSWFIGFRVDVAPEDELLVLVMLEIPTADEYKYIKFDIARELISIDEPIDENAPPEEVTPTEPVPGEEGEN